MPDITTVWGTANSRGDWALAGAMLESGNDLQTAYFISIFSDRMAQPGDVIPDGSNDRRGWIGDAGSKYPIGSRLWLLDRAKATQKTANLARTYVTEAVQWLIDDKVVARHAVTVKWIARNALGIWITAYKPDGTTHPAFYWAWQQLGAN